MTEINEKLLSFGPCFPMWFLGYALALPTLGISLLIIYFGYVNLAISKIKPVMAEFNAKHKECEVKLV